MAAKTQLTPDERLQLRERMNELSDRAEQRFKDAVQPIYGASEFGEPEHIGSCILIDLQGMKVLLTAGHVIDGNKNTTLYVGGARTPVAIEAQFLGSTSQGRARGNDRYDFAAAKLQADVATLLGDKFVAQGDIVTGPTIPPRYLTALGYPNSKNSYSRAKGVLVPKMLPYSTNAQMSDELANRYGESGKNHLFLGYGRYSRSQNGEKTNSIAPVGMSGGAVIDAGNIADPKVFRGEMEPTPRLAGVTIELWRKNQVLVATSLHCIVPVLLRELPKT